jgi:hypothetical protein
LIVVIKQFSPLVRKLSVMALVCSVPASILCIPFYLWGYCVVSLADNKQDLSRLINDLTPLPADQPVNNTYLQRMDRLLTPTERADLLETPQSFKRVI